MDVIGIIIFSVIALIFISLGVAKIISMLRGKIEISLSNFNYSAGDTISGTAILNLRKSVEADSLDVGLIAESSSGRGVSIGNVRTGRRQSSVVFSFSQPISGKKLYPAGESSYNFTLKIPMNPTPSTTGNAVVDSIVKTAQILGGTSTLRWYVTAELDVAGMNLSRRVQINIG